MTPSFGGLPIVTPDLLTYKSKCEIAKGVFRVMGRAGTAATPQTAVNLRRTAKGPDSAEVV